MKAAASSFFFFGKSTKQQTLDAFLPPLEISEGLHNLVSTICLGDVLPNGADYGGLPS